MNNEFTLSDIIEKLKNKLEEYIEISKIKINDNNVFLCPAHKDNNPSASLDPKYNNNRWKCFSCGAGGDIYDLAKFHENLDTSSNNFVKATKFLLNKFDDLKAYDNFSLQESDVISAKTQRINVMIAELIKRNGDKSFANQRGWNKETCEDLCIGTIPYNDVREYIKKEMSLDISEDPYSRYFMRGLFSSRAITITLFDQMNKPIGFAARNVDWTEGSSSPKYINSADIPDIFKKEKHLYQIGRAVKEAKDKGFLYVFEGYGSVIIARQNGIMNCTAICGLAFTEKQIKLIHSLGIHRVALCFDSDTRGIEATKNFFNDTNYLNIPLNFEVVDLPQDAKKENCDSDAFIRNKGTNAFKNLKRLIPFEWLLNHNTNEAEQKVKDLIPHIANGTTKASWQNKIKLLSDLTGIDKNYIKNDVEAYINNKNEKKKIERKTIIDKYISEVRECGPETASTLARMADEIAKIDQKDISLEITIEDCLDNLNSMISESKSYDPNRGVVGWRTGYPILDIKLDGMPKSEQMISIGGLPHSGKSGWCLNIATKMLELTDEGFNQDLAIYIMTIDDSSSVVYSRMLAIMTGIPMRDWKRMSIQSPELTKVMDSAVEQVNRWIKKGHLIIADASRTTDLNTGINNMLNTRKTFPNHKNLFILDNLHKLEEPEGFKERFAIKRLSNIIHTRITKDSFTTLTTVEMNKSEHINPKIGNAGISDSRAIEYDSTAVILINNPMLKDKNTVYQYNEGGLNHPIIAAEITKNKVNNYKETLYYKFNTTNTRMEEIVNIGSYIKADKVPEKKFGKSNEINL